MEEKIIKLLSRADYTPCNVPELLRNLGLRPNQQQVLQQALGELERNGQILRTKHNRYIPAREADLVAGVIQITRQGKGYLQPDSPGTGELVIPENATFTAFHGDRVLVRRDVWPGGGRRVTKAETTGAVVRVLERRRSQLVGTFQRSKQLLYVIPDDPRIPHQIYVPPPSDVGRPANPGDKVVVELQPWESRNAPPQGEIIVLRQYDLPLHFPKRVLQEANAIARSRRGGEPLPEELVGRVDCRGENVITIDPDDAKDFDDAIFLQKKSGGQWKLCVHIADVSHYVKPGSALDIEAHERGNSTYLVDRVIPMLPEALSNEICSLKPQVDRLTKCVEFLLSDGGEVLHARFYPAVIRSKRRFSYQEAFACLQRPPLDDITMMLHQAHEMAQKIRRARFKAGSLDLEFAETKIRLDEHGKIIRIEKVENDVSHQLIEEYMLLANEAVAGRLMSQHRPAVYRVHEPPKPERLELLRDDILRHEIPCGDLSRRTEVQRLLQRLNESPIGPALKIGFLKSLMRARYAVEPLGHYGLAKAKYTHFTSPIRRYADLVVHRALFEKTSNTHGSLQEVARHISDTERNSADAERDSKDVKLYAHLTAQLRSGKPEAYPALVTDVQNFAFFIDVPALGMSGAVRLSTLTDDFYVFQPDRHHVVGRRTHRVIKLGGNVMVQVYKVDLAMKRVDFTLVGSDGSRGPEGRRAKEQIAGEIDRGKKRRKEPGGFRKESKNFGRRR